MMLLLDVFLSLVATYLGLMMGGLFWAHHLGLDRLRRLLLDDSALNLFWRLRFEPHGGVGAILRQEGVVVGERTPCRCASMSTFEVDWFVRMRRKSAIAVIVLAAACLVVSAYTSAAVVICFTLSVVISMWLSGKKYSVQYAFQSLAALFRTIRLWMDADRESLDKFGSHWFQGIVRVLDENEPIGQSLSTAAA